MRSRASSEAVTRAQALLAGVIGKQLSDDELLTSAVTLARTLLEAAEHEKTAQDRKRAALLSGLMLDEAGQAFTTLLPDRAYRTADPGRVVDQARYLIRMLGVPDYLPLLARTQLQLMMRAGPFLPDVATRAMRDKLRDETREVVISADDSALAAHLALRKQEGVRVNVNHLGEAVLGEQEARARIDDYCGLLARPDVEAISVKLSSIASQIELLSWQETLDELRPRLRVIYHAALQHSFERSDGTRVTKLVSLDMEAYRDLRLTAALFMSLLDEPELLPLQACIVLQAYLPDSFALQRELTDWAARRVAAGGAPARLRIVKGANLAAERVESSLRGWPLPIYGSKLEVDASYKRMVAFGCQPQHARVLHLGIASHNVFDIALGLVLRAQHGVEACVGFELLEGMADPLRRALRQLADDVLVYCPVVDEDSMQTAIAYLTRRLDENTARDNFLRQSFAMRAGDPAWENQRTRFTQAFALRERVSEAPLRVQDRRQPAQPPAADGGFVNEPDSDFSLPAQRLWITECLQRAHDQPSFDVPFSVGSGDGWGEQLVDGFDPSRPAARPYRHALAGAADIERALATATRAAAQLRASSGAERSRLLADIAQGLRFGRGALIAEMVLDAGKRVDQADSEVSEAIDFAEYYRRSYLEYEHDTQLRLAPKGVVLVTPPWNFPLAIPAGGVFAALMAGNAVILKPALETPLVARRLAEICWAAGVPREWLQLVLCEDQLGSGLIRDARVHSVVLTGATSTARLFHELRPGLPLLAETGGKNAVIVSALADRDAAVQAVLQSALGHAGQKCSAASLLICEAEVYDDPAFMRVLQDATQSLLVGSAWDPRSVVTPLIRPPSGALARALTTLEAAERWLVTPEVDLDNPRVVSPGVKLGVVAGSASHRDELFGPVLSVMRADDLDHAIALANGTSYGLTSGLFSLDEREQRRWSERIEAGNLYINRGITGAIVQRQPFGGRKGSSFGPGAKAGGPNYVLQLCQVSDAALQPALAPPLPDVASFLAPIKRRIAASDHELLARAACRYAEAMRQHFALDHDPSQLLGEQNRFRYQACTPMLLRASSDAVIGDALLVCLAALSAQVKLIVSLAPELTAAAPWLANLLLVQVETESAERVAQRVSPAATPSVQRVRALGSLEPELRRAALTAFVHVATEPVSQHGRIELLHYLREQSLSIAYHRHGNLQGQQLLG